MNVTMWKESDIDTKYLYTFTKHSQLKNNFKLFKIFQNEQGTLLNKVKQLITASPTLTTYPLLSQLHPIWLRVRLC